ncbi:helix-turn-helix domain-containing protein [Paenibacillus sp. LMG 31456]|uniref:Helix-turn-helix domain-containing protein n=1 Tax=Paenibacillus foliorum TaxID=2654974 RepID=A0A972GRP2_9BACL|nr:helix-turn-helix transcriptional regulator [Paenibacillus foliorum]NOU95621.1 helix-turn-helix domain-containing protein [Paenibacillus foliorum]
MNQKRSALIQARKVKGFTQEKLAFSAGITRAYLANIERGEHDPSLKVAQKLACILDRDTDELFFEDDVRKTNIRYLGDSSTG